MKLHLSLLVLFLLFYTSPLYGKPVKDFSFIDINGGIHSWGNLKGMPLVVNIGSHWWKKCKDEAPELQRAYSTYRDQGVIFLGVFVMSKAKDVNKFAKKYQLTFPVGIDNGIAEALGARAIPETIFINKEGKIQKRYSGTIRFDGLKQFIDEIIK